MKMKKRAVLRRRRRRCEYEEGDGTTKEDEM